MCEIPVKEINDLEVFDAGIKSVSECEKDGLVPHFIYCGLDYFRNIESTKRLQEIFLTKMRKYGIPSSIFTMMHMWRWKLVTKEKVKQAYEGKLKNDTEWNNHELSIHDDVETFFTNLEAQKEIQNEWVPSFFLPKLTEDELKLVEERNELHFCTYSSHYNGQNPDVNPEEMKKSDSRSKYVYGRCIRYTLHLAVQSNQNFEKDGKISNQRKTSTILKLVWKH